jgi:hypothetical protein
MLNKTIIGILMYVFCHNTLSATLNTKDSPFRKLGEAVQTLNLADVGETTFSVLFWDIYKSKLQATAGYYPLRNKQGSILYEINYLADITGNELIERTVEQWQYLGVKPEKYELYLSELKLIWPDIHDGDTLSLLIHDGRSTFYFNQIFIGIVESADFGQLFLDIWLSENTSQPALRHEILGGSRNE